MTTQGYKAPFLEKPSQIILQTHLAASLGESLFHVFQALIISFGDTTTSLVSRGVGDILEGLKMFHNVADCDSVG
jgi:hypothetical protein